MGAGHQRDRRGLRPVRRGGCGARWKKPRGKLFISVPSQNRGSVSPRSATPHVGQKRPPENGLWREPFRKLFRALTACSVSGLFKC